MRLESHKVTYLSNGLASLHAQRCLKLKTSHFTASQSMPKSQQSLDFLRHQLWVGLAITLALMSGLRETLALWRAASKNS